MTPETRKHVLDPATRLGEVLFGLIMVLTCTGSLHAASAGRDEVRTLLRGALGCNLAWGIVDAVMYLLDDLIERNRTFKLLRRIQEAKTDAEADRFAAKTLPDDLAAVMPPGDIALVRERMKRLPLPKDRARVTRESLAGAFSVFLLVFCSTFPAAAPFLFIQQQALALRVSNAIAVGMMFIAGFLVGGYAGLSRFVSGFAVALIGVALVGVTMLFGG
jgi:VIT1/CCC1 family predicted Fe2+/Mn2+ transporter